MLICADLLTSRPDFVQKESVQVNSAITIATLTKVWLKVGLKEITWILFGIILL